MNRNHENSSFASSQKPFHEKIKNSREKAEHNWRSRIHVPFQKGIMDEFTYGENAKRLLSFSINTATYPETKPVNSLAAYLSVK